MNIIKPLADTSTIMHQAVQRLVWRYPHSGTCRASSGWLGGLLGSWRKTPSQVEIKEEDQEEQPNVSVSPEQVLENIAQDHIPTLDTTAWKQTNLGSTQLKGEILCSFENTFNRKIPNQKLASITTFSDLLEILDTTSEQETVVKIFPNIVDDGTLPPNLSIQFISTELKKRPVRKPFQNFDSRRPEHATFLSKEERERRKKKRRHLTAWK